MYDNKEKTDNNNLGKAKKAWHKPKMLSGKEINRPLITPGLEAVIVKN